MRFSRPRITSRLRSPMSASTTATFLPSLARATPRFAVVVVLPTPPLPEVTTMHSLMGVLHFASAHREPAAVVLQDDGSVLDMGDLGREAAAGGPLPL